MGCHRWEPLLVRKAWNSALRNGVERADEQREKEYAYYEYPQLDSMLSQLCDCENRCEDEIRDDKGARALISEAVARRVRALEHCHKDPGGNHCELAWSEQRQEHERDQAQHPEFQLR